MGIQDFLTGLLAHMGIESSTADISQADDAVIVSIHCEETESGLLIGRHAETLDAIQHILRLLYQKEYEKPIVLNINDFRESREAYVKDLALRMAERVMETGNPQTLHLPAHERRLVHMTLADHESVTTVSEGEGIYRVLKVLLKE